MTSKEEIKTEAVKWHKEAEEGTREESEGDEIELEKRTIEIIDKYLNEACNEVGITSDWLINRMIPENLDKRFPSTFQHLRQAFERIVRNDDEVLRCLEEWSRDQERSAAFTTFQRQANNLTELILDAKSGDQRKIREWERHGVDVREYKGKDTVMIHKNTELFELMLTANVKKIPPFDHAEFRKALADDLDILQRWVKGGEVDKTLAEEACEIIYETLKPEEIEYIEQVVQRHSACWGAPNRFAGHVINLTGPGMGGLFEIWTHICKTHGFWDEEISSPIKLEQILFYDEFLGKTSRGKNVPNINMLPHTGCPFKMWQHLLLKLASVRGHEVSSENLDRKSLKLMYEIETAANEEALKLVDKVREIKEIRKEVGRALKKTSTFGKKMKGFKMEILQIKRIILSERGLTPEFCLNSFQDMLEFLILDIFGVEVQEKEDLITCIRSVLTDLPTK